MKHKLPFIKYYYLVVWMAEKNYPSKYDLTKLLEEKELFLSERTLYRHIKDRRRSTLQHPIRKVQHQQNRNSRTNQCLCSV